MTDKTTAALKLAEEALGNLIRWMDANKFVVLPKERKNLVAIREALAEQSMVLNDPHPPHRLCECTACLEYWTPLPDCDAFAASGKVIGCAYCDNPLFAGTKCNNCGRVTLAEPVKQEPVASVVAMLDKCISIIGTEMNHCKQAGDKWFMCQRFIHAIQDMQYEFKRDYAAPVSAEAIRAEALEQAAKVCEQGTGDAVQTDVLKALWKERERIAEVIRGLK